MPALDPGSGSRKRIQEARMFMKIQMANNFEVSSFKKDVGIIYCMVVIEFGSQLIVHKFKFV